MKHYGLIIFDLDDTLFDYEKTEKNAVLESCEGLGINFEGNLYSQYKTANNIIRNDYKVLTSINIQQFRISRVKKFFSLINYNSLSFNNFIEEYLKHSTVGVLIEGVQETLENLKDIIKVVATNGPNMPRQNKLESSSISKYFDAFFSAEDLGVTKPDSEFFLKIIRQFDIDKNEVLSVGDDYSTDILGAVELGIDSCWFNYRKRKQTLTLADNVYIIEKFNEIIDIVNRE